MAAYNAIVGYILNFHVHMLLKGAVILIIIINNGTQFTNESQHTHYM